MNLRFKAVVAKGLIPFTFYHIPKAERLIKDKVKHSVEERFNFAKKICWCLRTFALTESDVYGKENLPAEGGYIMYSNHQGKYDGVSLICYHDRPFSILWDIRSAHQLITSQISRLLDCDVIDTSEKQNFMPVIKSIVNKVNSGRPCLVFPEGKTSESNTQMFDFQTGCFMASTLSKTPIVPVVLYDSHKSMNTNDIFHKVRTQIYFLKPITYEEYSSYNRKVLALIVRDRIQEKLDELNGVTHVSLDLTKTSEQ